MWQPFKHLKHAFAVSRRTEQLRLRSQQRLVATAEERLTHQILSILILILSMWQPFKHLKQAFAVSRRTEQLRLRSQQRLVATAEDSVLRTEMASLESQEEDAPKRILWFKPMSWLGQIRPHRRSWAPS
jgi:hypothetical protein